MTRDYLRPLLLVVLLTTLSACGTQSYQGTQLSEAGFLQRAVVQQQGEVTVSAAVPTAEETIALTGLDLYEQGIQPVWIKIENNSESNARALLWSIDREYFSPIEVAYTNRKRFSSEGYAAMERWLYQSGLPRITPPGETRSGLVFTHYKPGSKGFNLTMVNQRKALDFTFFVPMPGFVADFMLVDFAGLYTDEERRDLSHAELRTVLEQELPCCTTDREGIEKGGPLNLVLVGSGKAVRRAMLRGDWIETSGEKDVAVNIRKQSFHGRQADGLFSQHREDGNERLILQLWLSPWTVEGEPVWVGQVFYFADDNSLMSMFGRAAQDSAVRLFFARESISADIDGAQRYLFQNLWYNGSLREVGFVSGVGKSTVDEPAYGFQGVAYFTDGWRVVAFLSEKYRNLVDIEFVYGLREGFDRERAAQ